MNKTQKVEEVAQLAARFAKAKAAIFADFRGMSVTQMTDLRTKMRRTQATLKVVKNRLVKRALTAAKLEELSSFFTGPTAMAASEGDAAALAKALVEFTKENEKLQLKGGYIEGRVVDSRVLQALAKLPSREVLLGQVAGVLRATAQQVVNVLSAVPGQLVRVLKAMEGVKKS
ncbi:MAG: 50S ribosomal protein L10 [Deltaproteobacteria bacterium]|nr:50S ribosomal protein L10 [Deltaproteobacteria bacterium]